MFNKRGIKLFHSKKGLDIDLWFNVFELVIVVLVGYVLFDLVNSESNNTKFEKNYLARDNALLLNMIYASPGDITYNYPYSYSERSNKFVFNFKQNKIEVYEPDELIEGGVVSYPFAEDKNYNLVYTTLYPKNIKENKITYSKDKKDITITN